MESVLKKFEKVKKYSENSPAFYNERLLQLREDKNKIRNLPQRIGEVENDLDNLLYIQIYLYDSNGDIEELELKLGIKVTKHPMLPLLIFNYDHLTTPHDSLIGLECRGLVIENRTWRVVAKPMNRFFNWGEIDIPGASHPNFDRSQFDFSDFTTQSKEDGSLMVLFYYEKIGKWMLNTRTYFLNEVSDEFKIMMGGINEVYAKDALKTFEKSLHQQNKKLKNTSETEILSLNSLGEEYLDKNCTYCFEFCSSVNKIVRTYEEDTTFLLAIIDNKTHKEYSMEEVDRVASLIRAKRPVDFNLKTFNEVLEAMKEVITKDPSLEGFVIRDKNSSRWKIKSPSYFFLHHISYDFMRTPYPKDLVPLILQGEGTELFSILELNGYTVELNEIKKQWDLCEKRLNEAFEIFRKDCEKVKEIKEKDELDLLLCTEEIKTPLIKLLREFNQKCEILDKEKEKFDFNNEIRRIWAANAELLVEKLFTKKEQNPPNIPRAELKTTPVTKYKKMETKDTLSKDIMEVIISKPDWWKFVEDEKGQDGVAKEFPVFKDDEWYVECYCGGKMNLFSVPEHMFSHKCARYPYCNYCKTGINIDKNKFKGKMSNKVTHSILIYQCECGLAHQAHQKQGHILNERKRRPMKGKPLGVPCSHLGLIYRHRLHEEMELVMVQFKWDKDKVYSESANILECNMEEAHVGMLGISQCRKLIQEYREMRGEE